jgi:MFS family permease
VAAIPGALAVMVAIAFVREQRVPPVAAPIVAAPIVAAPTTQAVTAGAGAALPRSFWLTMLPILVFTLGNSTDAFLLLRASQLGVPTALIPLVWVLLHLVKSASSTPAGALSDRVGRRPLIVAGWVLYAAVYAGFALAADAWHAWALFGLYGVVFGLTEGAEKALVADLVPARRRGTAFGWYQATVGVAALPASIAFGVVWDRYGSPAAFAMGAALAVGAAVIMSLVVLTPPDA